MDVNKKIKIVNRSTGPIGYKIPELGIRRQFAKPRAWKEVTFGELQALMMDRGGEKLVKKYLVICDEEARRELMPNVEPEYFYDAKDVKRILTEASYEEFLDCLDFAPAGVIDMLKDMAVTLELNDMRKRNAIQGKLNFDVTKAIEIKNTKFDDGSEDPASKMEAAPQKRRATTPTQTETAEPQRRVPTPKYSYAATNTD